MKSFSVVPRVKPKTAPVRDILGAMQEDTGIDIPVLKVDGGATNNDYLAFCQPPYNLLRRLSSIWTSNRFPSLITALISSKSKRFSSKNAVIFGFSRGQGCTPDDIFFKELKGVEYAYVKKFIPGKSAKEVLSDVKEPLMIFHGSDQNSIWDRQIFLSKFSCKDSWIFDQIVNFF